MTKALVAAVAATTAVAAALVLAACGNSQPDVLANYATPQEYARALFDDVNTERMAGGELGSFTWSDCLAQKALPRAERTLTEDNLSHETLVATCTEGVAAGENLSRGAFTPQEIVAKWMASPGHAQNIERAGFADAGVGCVAISPGDPTKGYACSLLFEGGD